VNAVAARQTAPFEHFLATNDAHVVAALRAQLGTGDERKTRIDVFGGAAPVGHLAHTPRKATIRVVHLTNEVQRTADVRHHHAKEHHVQQHVEHFGNKVGPEREPALAVPRAVASLIDNVEHEVHARLHRRTRQQRRLYTHIHTRIFAMSARTNRYD